MTAVAEPRQPRIIRRVIRQWPTATRTVLVDTDQGEGYLKAIGGDPTGPHTLACEWVGTQLARWIGLRTFDFALIKVTEEDEIPLAGGDLAIPGVGFITRAERGAPWGGKVSELRRLANPEDIIRLVVFDTWTLNCDRYFPPRRPNRDNVFLSREGAPPKQFILKAIDHTHCFTCGRELSRRVSNIAHIKDRHGLTDYSLSSRVTWSPRGTCSEKSYAISSNVCGS